MPALPAVIIDSHHHFWTGMQAFGFSDYMPNDYLADVAPLGARIRASIFAECNTQYDRTAADRSAGDGGDPLRGGGRQTVRRAARAVRRRDRRSG